MEQIMVYDMTSESFIKLPKYKILPCGQNAKIAQDGSYPAYRCLKCNAVEGSVSSCSKTKRG